MKSNDQIAATFDLWAQRTKEISKITALMALTALAIVAAFSLTSISRSISRDGVLGADNSAAVQAMVRATSDQLNGNPGTATAHHMDKIEGVLPQTRQFLADTRRDEIELNKLTVPYYTNLQTETGKVFTRANKVLDSVSGAVDGLNASQLGNDAHNVLTSLNIDIKSLDKTIGSTNDVLAALKTTIGDLDDLARDPDIKSTLAEIAATSKEVDLTVGDLRKVADKYERQLTAPMSKKEKILAALDFVLRGLQVDYAIQLLKFKH